MLAMKISQADAWDSELKAVKDWMTGERFSGTTRVHCTETTDPP